MEDCIFCKIVKKEIPAAVVYEDDQLLAFLTIEAVNEGHTLVIPKAHIESVHETEEDLYSHAMKVVRKLSHAVQKSVTSEKMGILVSGWEVPHAHIHVVPMTMPQDLTSKKLLENRALHPSEDERKITAEKIKSNLA